MFAGRSATVHKHAVTYYLLREVALAVQADSACMVHALRSRRDDSRSLSFLRQAQDTEFIEVHGEPRSPRPELGSKASPPVRGDRSESRGSLCHPQELRLYSFIHLFQPQEEMVLRRIPSIFLNKRLAAQLHLLLDALRKFYKDHGFFLSSSITFNLLICFVPLTLLLLALVGTYLYSDREILNHIRHYVESAVPSLDPRIMKNILRIIRDRKIVGVLGMGGLAWASTWVFSSLRTALNMVLQVEDSRSLVRGKAIDLLMVLFAGFLLLLSMAFTSGITIIQSYRLSPFLKMGYILRFALKYVLPFFLTCGMCFLIYKIIPYRKIHFKPALQAALLTSFLWEVAKQLFGWYVLHLGRFSMVYGSLSTLAIFFLWIYYSSAILILGGEMVFLLEQKKGYR